MHKYVVYLDYLEFRIKYYKPLTVSYRFLIIRCCFLSAFISASLKFDKSTDGGISERSTSKLWTMGGDDDKLFAIIGFGDSTILLGGETWKYNMDLIFLVRNIQ
jgi:hypothetical protein